eukprot:4609799-Alexandrium_andersonii.AAC.1
MLCARSARLWRKSEDLLWALGAGPRWFSCLSVARKFTCLPLESRGAMVTGSTMADRRDGSGRCVGPCQRARRSPTGRVS